MTASRIFCLMIFFTWAQASIAENVVNIYSARHYDTDMALYERFTKETGLPVFIADDPLACVAIGTGKALEQEETFSTMLSEY